MAGILISCLGLAPNYGWLLVMVALGGAGIAAFHPQATSQATLGIGRNRGRAMAAFISAGTLGYALGPTCFSMMAERFGLSGTWWAAIPGVLVSVLLLLLLPPHRRTAVRLSGAGGFDWAALRAVRKPLTILYLLVFIRSIVQITFAQFIPLYLWRERGFASRRGQLRAHRLSDLRRHRRVYRRPPGGPFRGQTRDHVLDDRLGAATGAVLSWPAAGFRSPGCWLGGLVLLFTIPVNVMMAQELVPSQAGTISALMMGFAWGMAGLIFIPLTGWALGPVLDAPRAHGSYGVPG